MITIVDYGLGNINAFVTAYKRVNRGVKVARCANDLRSATKLILPGVGHFDHAMRLLTASGMRDRLEQIVFGQGIPILGVCVGMQILGESSDEGRLNGLGWMRGRIRSFRSSPESASLP